MRIKILLFICMSFHFLVSSSQPDRIRIFELKKEISSYCYNSLKVFSITYEICNKSTETLWFWLDKNDISKLSDSLKIREYFFQRKDHSDASLYQISMDRNVEIFIPEVFNTFIKIVLPEKCFTIQIISKKSITKATEKEIFKYLDSRIVVYSEKDLKQYIPSLNEMSPMVFFKGEFITLQLELLTQMPIPK